MLSFIGAITVMYFIYKITRFSLSRVKNLKDLTSLIKEHGKLLKKQFPNIKVVD